MRCFLGLMALLALVSTSSALASETIYLASNVKGLVLTRAPNAARWRPVKDGTLIPEDQLIQVTNGATVTLKGNVHGKVLGLKAERFQIVLTKPIVARLSSDLLRDIKLSPLFVERPPELLRRAVDVPPPAPLSLKDAWERLAAIITGIPPIEPPPSSLAELEREGVAVGISANKLRLLTPVMNSVVEATDWPLEVRAVWLRPEGVKNRYLIYAWRAGTPRREPRAMVKSESYKLRFDQPGTYFVQVTTADGKWQSPAHVVHALAPTNAAASTHAPSAQIDSVAEPHPLYPPDGFISPAKGMTRDIDFTWALDSPWSETEFIFRVEHEGGGTVWQLKTRAKEVDLELSPGRYVWSVGTVGSNIQGERRSLAILDGAAVRTSEDRLQVLQHLLSGNADATLALDDL